MNTLRQILDTKIVAIIRGAQPADAVQIAQSLVKGGIQALEITINSPKALQVIEQLADEMGGQVAVGAGTVLDAATARAAISAGAKFLVSPVLDKKTIQMAKRYGIVSIPGAYSPTEILKAYVYGGDIIKVFPASVGTAFFRDIRGPLPQIPLMPTGGINLENIQDYQKAGAVAFGLGSSLVDNSKEITPQYLIALQEKAVKFLQAVSNPQ